MSSEIIKNLPYSKECEENIIGSLILDFNNSFPIISNKFYNNIFFNPINKILFDVIIELDNDNKDVNITSVFELSKKKKKDIDVSYINDITNKARSISLLTLDDDCKILIENHSKRESIKLNESIDLCYNPSTDISDVINIINNTVESIESNLNTIVKKTSIKELAKNVLTQIENRQINFNNNKLSGVPSGFTDIDRITNGWQNGNLIIIAARPAVGKTAFAIELAKNAAKLQYPNKYFSIEMSANEIVERMILGEITNENVNINKIKKGDITNSDWNEINNATNIIINLSIEIDDETDVNTNYIRNELRKAVKNNCKLAIIDLLTQINPLESNKNKQTTYIIKSITTALKKIAKKLNIPIILLHQISREVAKRTDHEPNLADLRDSGSIEEDADVVIFIHRPDYFDKINCETPNLVKIIIAKHRNGRIGNVILYRNETISKFYSETEYAMIKNNFSLNDLKNDILEPNYNFEHETNIAPF